MNNSTIINIFHGCKGYIETMPKPIDKDACRSKAEQAYNKLAEKLSPELIKLHNELIEADSGVLDLEVNHYFKEGFKLGLRIGIECAED